MAWLVAACVRGGSVAASDCAGRCHGKRAACVRCDTDVLGRAGDGYVACTHARCPFGIGMGRSCRCRVVCSMSACRMACRGRYGSVMPYDVMLSACVLPVLRLLALPRACVVLPQRVACVSVMLPVVTLMGFACGGHVARLAPSHRLRIGGLP